MIADAAYRRLARPVLFALGGGDAEIAHHRTLALLGAAGRPAWLRRGLGALLARHRAPLTVFGIDFSTPVGVAAGLDKDGVAAAAWGALGFGFAELGTVTAQAQPGNDRPRLFRLVESQAIVNRMGFNNSGAAALATRLAAAGPLGIPVGISIGKSKVTPVADAVGDYLSALRAVAEHADYLAVNVSSPNTFGLRTLQDRDRLDVLLGELVAETRALARSGRDAGRQLRPSRHAGRPIPVLVKVAPDLDDHALAELLQVCTDRGVAGIIATNTTLARDGVAPRDRKRATEAGGLSGQPLRHRALAVTRFVVGHCELPVVGVGGIMTPDDALAQLDAGAVLVQLYTGFVYRGPALVTGINRAVAARRDPELSVGGTR